MKRLILVSILALLPGCMPPDYTNKEEQHQKEEIEDINWKRI